MPDFNASSPRFNPPRSSAVEGNIVPSGRWTKGAWLFRDETLHSLEILLDEAFRIPFTRFRFGIDGIIGLVPGLGDVIAGILSLVIPIAAWPACVHSRDTRCPGATCTVKVCRAPGSSTREPPSSWPPWLSSTSCRALPTLVATTVTVPGRSVAAESWKR